MTTLYRIRTVWSYTPGGPGYTNMFFGNTDPVAAGAAQAGADVQAFWTAIKSFLPAAVAVQVDPLVALIEDVNGDQTGELTLSPAPTLIQGTGVGNYGAPAGVCVNWNTSSFPFGRRVRGRSYLVPTTTACFDTNGTLLNSTRATLETAANALVSAPSVMVVYTRERPAKAAGPGGEPPAVSYRAGASSPVVSATINDRVSVLRSRRD